MNSDEERERFRQNERLRQMRRKSDRDRDKWAADNSLRESHASTDPVPWLLGRRSPYYSAGPRWFDHGTRWTRDGKPYCLVGQPYGLHVEDLRELLALVDDHGLDVTVDHRPDWYYPGHVIGVVVKKP